MFAYLKSVRCDRSNEAKDSPLVSRMMLNDFGAQAVDIDMGVYLGGAYVFVAEHTLYDAQVGTALEQVGSEGVAQGVGADGLLDACLLGQFGDDVEEGDTREPALA